MCRWFFSLILLLTSSTFAFSQAKMSVIFDKNTYYYSDLTPYIETYIWIDGKTVNYVPFSQDSSKAEIDVLMLGTQGDSVLFYDRFNLVATKAIKDTTNAGDLVYYGKLTARQAKVAFELELKDLNNASNIISTVDTIDLRIPKGKLAFSNIEFIKTPTPTKSPNPFSKYDYDLVPVLDEFSEKAKRMDFFVEVYNAQEVFGENEPYLLKYYFQNFSSRKQLESYTFAKRQNAQTVNPFIGAINIEDLSEGHYSLVVEVRDKDAKLIGKQSSYFHKENNKPAFSENTFVSIDIDKTFVSQLNDPKELKEDILSIRPIAGLSEYRYATNVVKNGDVSLMKRFLFSFWQEFDQANPYEAYLKYKKQVAAVNEEFKSGGLDGYKTDRGRVYLQYGPPIARVKRYHESANYPYEIWQYDQLDAQTNVKFVFYNPDAMASNNFILLHSDLRGEVNNRQWEMYLSKQSKPAFGIDDNTHQDSQFGNRARDFYNNPR